MDYKEVSTVATDIKKEVGKVYTDIEFQGSNKITTKIGEQVVWNFTDSHGNYFGIYGFTNLNRIMENVQVGKLCRITYLGTKNIQTKFGMKDVHQVKVEVDDTEDRPEPPINEQYNKLDEKPF